MDRAFDCRRPPGDTCSKLQWISSDCIVTLSELRVRRPQPDLLALDLPQAGVVASTQTRGAGEQRLDHALEVERRSADALQHLARPRLLLERLCQFAVAVLQFG